MKTTLMALASAAALAAASPALADDAKIGILLGFTGPLESLSPAMALGAELAIAEVNESGNFMDGGSVTSVRGDDTCIDAGAATTAGERLVTSEGVNGIMGAMCSGVTGAVLQNVAIPNGMVMISPSATSPALTSVEDNGLFFRTAPSDARQGVIVADILADHDVKSAALTFTNNDYGKGLADSIAAAAEAKGIEITINAPHEDGKGDYSAEVAALASAGGDILIVAGYLDQGGRGIIQASLDSGAFDTFFLPDGMVGDALVEAIGDDLDGSYGVLPGSDSEGSQIFAGLAEKAGNVTGVYAPESYDAAALMLMAMQKSGSTDPATYKDAIMDVANAPGEKILPGELGKALKILADGGDVDYVGASDVELIEGGESGGSFREIEIKDGAIETVQYR
ncbi:branched-chain amino acid ABC transporter substrate-binding protein [Acuticoccus sediminis]|uniref:Branched-chain amino acid ABC transporter substrate-binding protein n=1 Tax=Acuticoccus sediminis TaxID=2184697 RepID=A0A8B2P4J5_9HYPH|nr:ABC transporter substrate-binding protein [Acuticoccus sediminis]RAI04042.1 branched-chain amino acid ABC transporter substrate-binding protein [Acuticoccus sediminis]